MSVVAETSKTALEIYTPVIVGLGAVVLGMLANAGLEWWKSYLAQKQSISSIRHAILFELIDLEKYLVNTFSNFDECIEQKRVSINISSYLIEMDREKIGSLSKEEVVEIASVVSMMVGLTSASKVEADGTELYGDIYFFALPTDAFAQSFRLFLSGFQNAVTTAKAAIEDHL